jgi:serine/threonine protein kinase
MCRHSPGSRDGLSGTHRAGAGRARSVGQRRAQPELRPLPWPDTLLRAEIGADPQALARFRAEACHAGGLAHQNITRVYDYGEPTPEHPAFLVMEFVDGTP